MVNRKRKGNLDGYRAAIWIWIPGKGIGREEPMAGVAVILG